jgi:CP family cyanate transporter-like MFS transporter
MKDFSVSASNRSRFIILVSILLVALNLRPTIASVSPVLEAIKADLGLSYATASLLTTIPTLCMGVFAVMTVPLARKLGRNRTIFLSILLITLATGLRIIGDIASVLFLSTIFAGIGIAVAQTLLPSLVQEHFSDNVGLVTGLYTTTLITGAALSAALTVPITSVINGSWTVGLAIWAVPATVGVLAWIPVYRGGEADSRKADEPRSQNLPWGKLWAWFLVFFFAGTQILFFSVLAWLSPRYVDLGWSAQRAGFVLSVFTVAELGGSLASSALTNRFTDRRPPLVVMLLLSSIGLSGIALLPLSYPWTWTTLTGIGIGGTFALALTLPVDFATSPEATDRLTAMMFGVGYILAATGPYVVGKLRSTSGNFRTPLIVLTAVAIALLASVTVIRPTRSIDV